MRVTETISNTPIGVEKTIRPDELRSLTSGRAGRILPVQFIPLLREDRVSRGSVRLQVQMQETIHPLMNAVNVTAYAHFVPFTAFERFKELGMDSYNRSYQGVGEPHNDTPIPYFVTEAYSKNSPFYQKMGIQWKDGQPINRAVREAYAAVVNFRRNARSKHLPEYEMGTSETALAAAFWKNPNMWHIVPDYDQAAMDGEVELQFVDYRVPLSGFGRTAGATVTPNADVSVLENAAGGPRTYPHSLPSNNGNLRVETSAVGVPLVFAELQQAGVRVSLQNIELAKKTAAFAKLRQQYSGMDEEHLMDLLMEGIRVPDEAMKQPILLDKKSSIFGYSERHATDGANLDKSVTTGTTELTLNFRTPAMNVQGIILVTLEIVPEQLFERMRDPFLAATNPDQLPNFMRDYLDPEKVSIVRNDYVDVEHSTPTGTFGYAPLNHEWKRSITRIGGKFYRKIADTFVEDRQRFWSVETLNPQLTRDFYLVPLDLPHTVFADMLADPFEILCLGSAEIVGNTVFGKTLEEDEGHYDYIMNQVDTDRINQG